MGLGKKVIEINDFEEQKLIMTFDMQSIVTFRELFPNENFMDTLLKLNEFDDLSVIKFFAITLRKVETPNKPLGKEFNNMNLMYFLLYHINDVMELVNSGLPQVESKKGKKNKKK